MGLRDFIERIVHGIYYFDIVIEIDYYRQVSVQRSSDSHVI